MQTDIGLPEYLCLLAESLDAEELDQYRWWINSQQDPKKFKWSSHDKAGTSTDENVMQKLFSLGMRLSKGKPIMGTPLEFQQATKKAMVYMDSDRVFYDIDKNRIDFDYKKNPGVIVVRI